MLDTRITGLLMWGKKKSRVLSYFWGKVELNEYFCFYFSVFLIMDNQVSGFCPPVSLYNYILHSLITSVNRLYGYEQLLWALLSHSVKAELVVVKELLDSVSGPAACGRNGIFFSWEDVWNRGQPSTWVLLLELAIQEPLFCLQVEDICTGYL